MKYYLIFVTLMVVSCSSTKEIAKERNTIPYLLPENVCELLESKLIKSAINVFFTLDHVAADTFRISLIKPSNNRNIFASLTNRKLLLAKKMYPLIFDYDDLFAASETGDKILKKAIKGSDYSYKKRFSLYHHYYYVTFIRNGAIIEEMYDNH
jgi:hypothetical protein